MSDAVELWEKPEAKEIYLIAGWRQWADAGSVSSGLPQYLLQQTKARQIGKIRPDGFYLFQIPGTHDLLRPAVKFDEGFPELLQSKQNEIFYTGDEKLGLVIFIGDEPHMDIERYIDAFLHLAESLGVRRILTLGGVYGELPYEKDRMISSVYSLPKLKKELNDLAVELSDYQGGASIGSYVARRAADREMEMVGFYAFVPTYDFSEVAEVGNVIRIENDFMAWLGIMRRINHMLKLEMDLADLEEKSEHLVELMDSKVEEIDQVAPNLGVREYMQRLSEGFKDMPFDPLDEVWEEELRRLFDRMDPDETS